MRPSHWVFLAVEGCFTITPRFLLSDQCKEIEESNIMGKSRDHFKKIRDTKGTFHAKMGLIKDRKDMEAWWQSLTQQ